MFSQGGAAKIAQTLHKTLNESSEFSIYFAYGRGKRIQDEKTFKFGLNFEIYLHAFLLRFFGIAGLGTYFSTQGLLNFIKKNNFDLIHLHNLHGYYLNYLNFVKELKNLGIPLVWTLHDEWPITGRCAHPLDCKSWQIGCGKCPDLSLYPKTYFFDLSAQIWQRKKGLFSQGWNPVIISPSQWLAERIEQSYLNKFQIEIIPNGVNTKLFKPRDKFRARKKFGLPFSKKIVLFNVPKLKDKQKGAQYFLETLKYLESKDFLLLTFGESLNLNNKIKNTEIRKLGYISNPNLIADVYNASDLLCLTSLAETFPLVVLEAMACALPVVGFKTGGVPEQVSPDCGILVKAKDTKGLANAIEELLEDNEKRNKLGLNCRQRALKNYSLENFKNQYINLYRDILKL